MRGSCKREPKSGDLLFVGNACSTGKADVRMRGLCEICANCCACGEARRVGSEVTIVCWGVCGVKERAKDNDVGGGRKWAWTPCDVSKKCDRRLLVVLWLLLT